MNYSDVKHSDTNITAKRFDATPVVIDKSISNLYHCRVVNKTTGAIHYNAITYNNQQVMRLVENFIRGRAYFSEDDRKTLNNIVVRFGWLDKTLNQLIWVPLVDIVEKFVRKELKGTEKGKFQEICKQLSLSIRDARTLHVEGDDIYNPRSVIEKVGEPPLHVRCVVIPPQNQNNQNVHIVHTNKGLNH